MFLVRLVMTLLRRPAPLVEDAFGSRLSRMGRPCDSLLPRIQVFRNSASRRAA